MDAPRKHIHVIVKSRYLLMSCYRLSNVSFLFTVFAMLLYIKVLIIGVGLFVCMCVCVCKYIFIYTYTHAYRYN